MCINFERIVFILIFRPVATIFANVLLSLGRQISELFQIQLSAGAIVFERVLSVSFVCGRAHQLKHLLRTGHLIDEGVLW